MVKLALNRFDDFWMVVPDNSDTCTAQEIQEGVAVNVFDQRTPCSPNRNRQPTRIASGVRFPLILELQHGRRSWAGNWGADERTSTIEHSSPRATHADRAHHDPFLVTFEGGTGYRSAFRKAAAESGR